MDDIYADLTKHLMGYLGDDYKQQIWICIAGGPGSGKSTLAAELVKRLNEQSGGNEVSVVLPMDGFHYSRKQLQHIALDSAARHEDKATIPGGDEYPAVPVSMDELLARRGAPWTFHSKALCQMLHKAKAFGHGALPVYSRQKSDPVFDISDPKSCAVLCKSHRIVIVEGNYLMLDSGSDSAPESLDPEVMSSIAAAASETDKVHEEDNYDTESVSGLNADTYAIPYWHHLHALFREKWYLSCESSSQQRQRLVLRHLETWTSEKEKLFGPGEEGAGRKADSNDMLNAINCERRKATATRVIISVDET